MNNEKILVKISITDGAVSQHTHIPCSEPIAAPNAYRTLTADQTQSNTSVYTYQ